MRDGQRFSFTERIDSLGCSVNMPYLPLTLSLGNYSVEVTALLDTGASDRQIYNQRSPSPAKIKKKRRSKMGSTCWGYCEIMRECWQTLGRSH